MKPTRLAGILVVSVVLACSVGWFDRGTVSFEALLDLQNVPALLLLSGLIFLVLTATLSVLEVAFDFGGD